MSFLKQKFREAIAAALSILLTASPVMAGGWIDDWLEHHTQTGGTGYYETQKRGYYSFGAWSARYRPVREPIFSIDVPRIRVGCGGIDIFGGGLGFLNTEYLVQMGQHIISVAPYIALELAISEVSEKLSNSFKYAIKIAEALNSMQFDECRSTKAVMVAFKENYKDPEKFMKDAWKNLKEANGWDNMWASVSQNYNRLFGGHDPDEDQTKGIIDEKDHLKDCPNIIKKLMYTDKCSTNGEYSLLAAVAKQSNIPQEYVEYMRGLIGDVIISWKKDGNRLLFGLENSCVDSDIGGIKDGTFTIKELDSSGESSQECKQQSDTTKLRDRFLEALNEAYDAMDEWNHVPSSVEERLVAMPASAYTTLILSVQGKTKTNLPALADISSDWMAAKMMLDLIALTSDLIQTAKKALTAKSEPVDGKGNGDCNVDVESLLAKLETLRTERLEPRREEAMQMFYGAIDRMNALMLLAKQNVEFQRYASFYGLSGGNKITK